MEPLKRGPVILVIDDDEVNQMVMERLLLRENFVFLGAEDGERGMALARSMKPDLILLDIFMPGEDGFSVLTSFKKDRELKDIPVCIFSILENQAHLKKAFDLGAAAHIPKPFDMGEVIGAIQKLLTGKPAESLG